MLCVLGCVLDRLHNTQGLPQGFVVPGGDGWAEEACGLQLGMCVSRLRSRRRKGTLPAVDVAQLDALGFVWSIPEWRWQCVLQSLAVYKEMHGDLEVPFAFVVPSEAQWPAEAWGLKLGSRVNDIRCRVVKHHPERRAELDAMGFVWDGLERRWEPVPGA